MGLYGPVPGGLRHGRSGGQPVLEECEGMDRASQEGPRCRGCQVGCPGEESGGPDE